ncbi:unnamed protein product [Cylicostephanus goldi]|uniref:ELYS beta-propeller domain-containing protein n=1 Tax=Cylicostephanus goldi TaxID=71465 RepID=A0A3P6SZC6_CYLGO|nr:unnamed protein product [Cylicostephanus goldi]
MLHVWQISPGILKESIDLGAYDGCLTTTVRFLHNPECNHAFACSAVGSSVFHLHMNSVNDKWSADKVFHVEPIQVENWLSPEMPALLTDLVISMNDKFAYVAGWLHGCIWQLDIADPFRVSPLNKVRNIFDVFQDRLSYSGFLNSFYPQVLFRFESVVLLFYCSPNLETI